MTEDRTEKVTQTVTEAAERTTPQPAQVTERETVTEKERTTEQPKDDEA